MMLFFPTVGCLIALIVHASMREDSVSGLEELIDTADWSKLGSATVRIGINHAIFINNLNFLLLAVVLCCNTSIFFYKYRIWNICNNRWNNL